MKLEDAEILACRLMTEHGLTDWEFGFDKAIRRVGLCRHYPSGFKVVRGDIIPTNYKGEIILSAPTVLLNSEDVVKGILLHEIAHAVAGTKHRHDKTWRDKSKAIGGDGQRLCGPEVVAFSLPRWMPFPNSIAREIKAFKNRTQSKLPL